MEWYCFPLEQVNSTLGAQLKLWEQPDGFMSRSLWAFRSGEAARLQGKELFERFHLAVMRARHAEKKDIANPEFLIELAGEMGLDGGKFRKDLDDRDLLAKIGEDYTRGVTEHGIWGTPTLVFNGRQAAYLKLKPAPPAEESVKLFEELFDIVYRRPYLMELKRPR
jgi:predicted DsbA family dithiol-disulfide isomerase